MAFLPLAPRAVGRGLDPVVPVAADLRDASPGLRDRSLSLSSCDSSPLLTRLAMPPAAAAPDPDPPAPLPPPLVMVVDAGLRDLHDARPLSFPPPPPMMLRSLSSARLALREELPLPPLVAPVRSLRSDMGDRDECRRYGGPPLTFDLAPGLLPLLPFPPAPSNSPPS